MQVESEQEEDIIDDIQERIDLLTDESKEEMEEAGSSFGNALWKLPLGGLSAWFFVHAASSNMHIPIEADQAWVWIGSAVVAGMCGVSGTQDIFIGVHHVRSHNAIMNEISTYRSAISRSFEGLLHRN